VYLSRLDISIVDSFRVGYFRFGISPLMLLTILETSGLVNIHKLLTRLETCTGWKVPDR
jgi:hypothetical protein